MQAAGVSSKAARLYRIKTFASPELFSMVCTENLSFPKIRSGPDSHPEAESSHHPGDACDPALARMFVGDLFKSRCLLEAENLFLRHQLSIACDILRAPIPGQKLVDTVGRMIGQPSEDVGKPGVQIDVVELRGRDECVDTSRPAGTFVGAGEGPVAAADRDGTQLAFGGIVGHA